MKKLLLALLVVLLTVTPVSAAPAPDLPAQPVTVPDQLAYIDAQVEVFTTHLTQFQMSYYGSNGQYFQALESHSAPPELLEAPDGLLSHPTDQMTPLSVLWLSAGLPAELGWSFRVDTYNGPSGPGYVVVLKTVIEGDTYQREINYGPETYRTQAWFSFEEF